MTARDAPGDDWAQAAAGYPELHPWLSTHAEALRGAGLAAEEACALLAALPAATRPTVDRLAAASRIAGLDPHVLPVWAAVGELHRHLRPGTPAGGRAWVTAIRRYVHAAGGNQPLAAAAARAGLDVDELAAGLRAGTLTAAGLDVLAGLRS